MEDASSKQILEAIGALDEKFDRRFGELKKADEHHVEELQRLGGEQRSLRKDVDELRNETRRTFDTERQAIRSTTDAIVKHVDDAAKAYREKAADIDTIKSETLAQSAVLKSIAGSPLAKKVAAAVAALTIAACGYGAMKIQQQITKIEERPTTVQPAPTVYVPVYLPADGGAK